MRIAKILSLKKIIALGLHLWMAGTASYYGPGLWGHGTSSGERLVNTKATCAMREYNGKPFNVLVYAPSTHKGIICRVNDYGPGIMSRIIDLNEYTKTQLGVGDLSYVRVYR